MPQPQPIDAILPRDDDPPRPTENYTYDGLICRVPFWKETFKWRSLDDYQYPYLSQVQDLPHLAGGPKACSRVSCTMDTAIAWCNDVSSPLTKLGLHAFPSPVKLTVAERRGNDSHLLADHHRQRQVH